MVSLPARRRRWRPLVAAGLLVAATLWVRAPTWNDHILFIDEAIGVTYGQRLQLPGATVYTHTPDQKPPLGPLTYLAAVTLSGAHAVTVVHAFTTIALGVTALLLLLAATTFADSVIAGLVAGLLYLLSTDSFGGVEPLLAFSSYDHFMAPWLVGFACAFLAALQRARSSLALLAGMLLGVAALYKQNAPVLVATAAPVAALAAAQGRVTFGRAAALAGAVAVGTTAVVAAPPLYYAVRGQFGEWWFANVVQLQRYSSILIGLTWWERANVLVTALPMPILGGLGVAYGVLGAVRRDRARWAGPWMLLAALCWATLLASLVPGQAKPHYVLQALPFQCGLIGLLPVEVWRDGRAARLVGRIGSAAAAIGLAVAVGLAGRDLFGARAILRDYSAADVYLDLHREARTLDPLIDYLRAHSTPDDLIYVQGAAPEFYVLAQRRPAASDAFQGWFVWPWRGEAGERLKRELRETPPRVIVQLGYRRYFNDVWFLDALPDFCAWLHANYREHTVADAVQVLERVDSVPAPSGPGTPAAVIPLGDAPVLDCALTAWMRLDRSAAGAPLSVNGTVYEHGLGVRAPASVTYAVPPGATAFSGSVAVDDRSADNTPVVFRVEVDGAVRFEHQAVRGDPPRPIAVDVAGAESLRLIVAAEPGAGGIDTDWLDARFHRPLASAPR